LHFFGGKEIACNNERLSNNDHLSVIPDNISWIAQNNFMVKTISVNFLVTTCFSVIINLARRICQVSLGQGQIFFYLIENVAEKERSLRRTACSKIDQFKLLMIIREKRCL
jgi:hypothetical protein